APTLSSIRVTGDARVTAKPDRVQIDVGVTTRATHSQDAAAENARQVEAMLGAVRKAAGPGAVLKTISYSLNPAYQYHPKGEEPTLTGEESSPRGVRVRAFMAGAVRTAAAPATPVESGTLDVTADVVLTVEVSPAAH